MVQLDNWPWHYWAKHRPQATAFIDRQYSYRWFELAQSVDRIAAAFSEQGVTENSGVALLGKNSGDLLFSYLAVLQLGARVLPLNPQLPSALLAELLPHLTIEFGWCADEFQWPAGITPLTLSAYLTSQTPHLASLYHPHRLATMILTSGSSGLPKAVVHTLQAHLDNADGLLEVMPFDDGDSWSLSLPLFHVSGQAIIWRWLLKGATLVLRDMADLAQALLGCTHASLVPTQLWRLLAQPTDNLTLKQVLLGGAAIPIELTEQAQRQGISCWCGYGLTEMASTVCAKRADGRPGVGMPLPGRQIKIVNNEILLSGNGLAKGYWFDGVLTPLSDNDGWFHTRDRGLIEQNELKIVGRMDNLFFSGGESIQPEDIERILVTHPQVEIAFVLPVADAEFGQRPVAVIQAIDEFDLTSLPRWLAGKIARFQIPITYYYLPNELKTGAIKISRKAVGDWLKCQRQS